MNPEQWLSLKWNGGSTMSDRWLNQSKIIHVQLKKLEGWEYIKSEKKLINGKGVTQYQITEIGIKQFEEYVVFLESVIADKNICECVFCTYES